MYKTASHVRVCATMIDYKFATNAVLAERQIHTNERYELSPVRLHWPLLLPCSGLLTKTHIGTPENIKLLAICKLLDV